MWKKADFEFRELLGEGVNTRVYRAIDKASGKHIAIKIILKKTVVELNAEHVLRREIEIQHHLKYTNQLQAHREAIRVLLR